MKWFSPRSRRLLVLLAALAGVAVTASMGRWQLQRAEQKQALVQARQDRAALPPLDGQDLAQALHSPQHAQALLHRAVRLRGQWLPGHTVHLENRQMRGRTGFFVLTPLRLSDGGGVWLVQRGWAPRHFTDREALPSVPTPAGEVVITGHLAPWPSRIYDFGAVEQGPIRQNLDFDAYRQQTGLNLPHLSVQQSGDALEGLLRDWPVAATGVEKHHGYAFQWFGLSALIALLYVWFQIVQPRRKQAPR